MDEHTPICPCCGEPLDDFQSLMQELLDVIDGKQEGLVAPALCILVGETLAAADPEARPKLRRLVNKWITEATKACLEADAEGQPMPAPSNLH